MQLFDVDDNEVALEAGPQSWLGLFEQSRAIAK